MTELKIHRMHNLFHASEEEAEPHATKVVRTRAHVVLREDDGNVELPSSYSKGGLYVRLMLEMGWNAKRDGHGNFGKLCDYEARDYRDDYVRVSARQCIRLVLLRS